MIGGKNVSFIYLFIYFQDQSWNLCLQIIKVELAEACKSLGLFFQLRTLFIVHKAGV